MADNKSDSIDPEKVEAISLDDWVVTPVSLDEWVVDDDNSSVSEIAAANEVDVTAETLVVPPKPVEAEPVENIDIDAWVLDDEEKSETKHLQIDISDDELEGSIEVDDQTFAESGSIQRESLSNANKTQVMNVGLQGDLAELEETSLEEISIESKTETPDLDEEDDDDLLSDLESESNMHLKDDPFEPEEPVPSIGGLEFPPTTMQNVELDLEAETSIEEPENEHQPEQNDVSLSADEPLPTDETTNDLEFPPTSMTKVELDFDSETAAEEMAAAKIEEQQEMQLEENDELDVVDSSVDLDLEDEPVAIELELDSSDDEDDELDLVESKIDYLDEEDSDATSEIAPISPKPEPIISDSDTAVQLEESDLRSAQALQLGDKDLAEQHWVRLSTMDLAESHQLGVLRLQESDLRENSQLPVIRLHDRDIAENHRKVIELDPHFFEDHNIERNVKGVILLKADDLVDPSVLDEEEVKAPKERRRKKTKETKESNFSNAKIVKISALVIIFCMVAIPIRMHFKYSWVTVSQQRYDEIKANTSGIDWVTKKMFEYRTKDSFWRWYGVRKLNSKAYTKAEDDGAMMWLRYDQGRGGDDYP